MNELFPYQRDGARWLTPRKVALLADEMGLGKSAQAITAADSGSCTRVLIICPAVARENWLREFGKFSTRLRNFTIVTTTKTPIPQDHSIIVSFDLATRISPEAFGQFDLVIIDEVHYLKSTTSKRSHAVFGKKGIIHGQKPQTSSHPGTKIWVLSGTPAPNHAGELWPLLYTFGRTNLGYADFCERFCILAPTFFGPKRLQITGTRKDRVPELRRILAPIILRRTKDQVGHMLPKIFYQNIVVEEGEVDLTADTGFIRYVLENRVDELEAQLKEEVDKVGKAISVQNIEVLKGLAKSVSSLRRYIGIQKIERTAELISNELRGGLYDKIVVFAIHQAVIEGLRVRLKEFHPLTLYGGTKFNSAHQNIDKFQNNKKFQVFIGNITACGIAINLTAAHHVLMIEQEWTPAANAQAIARCHRHGQTKPVTVRMVGLANSLDEKISQILKRKTEELTQIFDGATPGQTFEDLIG